MKQVFRLALGDVGPRKAGPRDAVRQRSGPAAAQFSWRFEAQLRCWTVSTQGDAITSGLRPRFPGRSIGRARFTFRRYTPLIRDGQVGARARRPLAGVDEQPQRVALRSAR